MIKCMDLKEYLLSCFLSINPQDWKKLPQVSVAIQIPEQLFQLLDQIESISDSDPRQTKDKQLQQILNDLFMLGVSRFVTDQIHVPTDPPPSGFLC